MGRSCIRVGAERVITKADLAAAWESGYWHGTSHKGPLNGAAVDAQNPYKVDSDTQPVK